MEISGHCLMVVETHTGPPQSRGPEPEAAHAADSLVVDADVLVEEVLVERADALALPVARRGGSSAEK